MQSRGEKNTAVSMWAGLEMLCMLTYLWSSAAFYFLVQLQMQKVMGWDWEDWEDSGKD